MIPVKLRIEGFLSYREPVDLDFTALSLACISGENGAGKSALLDAITWALFGQARRRDEALINDHPAVTAAQVTLDFDYEGNRYRVVRINPRNKATMVDFFIWSQVEDQGGWKTLSERTLRDTESKIEATLRMNYETFTNASFFLQGKADQFATARPADRKRILSNILGLEIWETYREATSQRRRMLEQEVKTLDARLSELQSELDQEPQRVERLAALESRLADLTKQRQERAALLENVRRIRTALDEQSKLLGTYHTQIENTTRTRDRVVETLATRREEQAEYERILSSAEEIEAAHQAWQATRVALADMEAVAEQFRQRDALRQEPMRIIQAEEARLQEAQANLAEQQAALQAALSAMDQLGQQLNSANERIAVANQKLAQRETLQAAVQQLHTQQAEAKAENPRLKDEMDELKERIDQLQVVEGVACPLCSQPLSADERAALIETLQQQGHQLGDRFRANKQLLESFESELNQIGAQLADLNGVDAALREATRQADQLAQRIKDLQEQEQAWGKTGAARLAEITAALERGDFAQDARTRLAEIDAELTTLGYDLKAHEKLRQAERAGREAEAHMRQLDSAKSALAPIARECADLEAQLEELEGGLAEMIAAHAEAAAQYAAAEADLPDLAQAEAELHDVQEQENQLRHEVGRAMQAVAVLETLKERQAGYLAAREEMTQHIVDHKQLERAFGKDGIPALLIEQALPEIEDTANQLLSRLSNGRMAFKFVTQREYKAGKREDLKETLDMVISDSVGARAYELFSGGEAFRVNFSIRLALSQVLARRAGARLQTLVIDEGFGSQDAQGRQRLVEAINQVKDDFEKILVITHLDELKDAFPTRIEVEKTPQGSQLQVI